MLKFNLKQEITVPENSQLNKTYALLKEVYGPLENLSQTQWSQIERGVKTLMKEHGPDIPIESLKAMKYTYDNFHTEKDIALDFMGNRR
jgi:hypothetical protein